MSDKVIGPTLPPNWKSNDNKDEEEKDGGIYGPALPKTLPSLPTVPTPTYSANPSTSRVIGPSIPRELRQKPIQNNDSDSDSDDMIGPIPETHHNFDKINDKFGDVSDILTKREAEKEVKREREEWMTVVPKQLVSKLPTKSVTHFSQRPVKNYDRKPDKKHKSDHKRDEELSDLMDSYNKSKKRDVSLIDIHNTKTKKEKKTDSKDEERVPFDPEKDLSVRRMDSRQTRSVLNKAKTFNDRFSLGINKFL